MYCQGKINQGINQSLMAQRDARCQKAKTQLQLCSTLLENNCYKSVTLVSQPYCMKQHLFRLEGIKTHFLFPYRKTLSMEAALVSKHTSVSHYIEFPSQKAIQNYLWHLVFVQDMGYFHMTTITWKIKNKFSVGLR